MADRVVKEQVPRGSVRGTCLFLRMSGSRFDRAAWLTVAFVVAFSVITIAATVSILALPGDGWQRAVFVATEVPGLDNFFGDWGTPLRVGDQVLLADGMDVAKDSTVASPIHDPNWQAGATVPYTLVRAGQTLHVPVTLHEADGRAILRAIGHAMQGAPAEWSWGLIGLVVFFLRPRNPAARLLFIMGVTHNVVTKIVWGSESVGLYFAPPLLFYIRGLATAFWVYLFIPSIILLVQSFPLRTFPFSRYPRLVPTLLYGVSFVVS